MVHANVPAVSKNNSTSIGLNRLKIIGSPRAARQFHRHRGNLGYIEVVDAQDSNRQHPLGTDVQWILVCV